MVDVLDLGSSVERRVGSSPISSTTIIRDSNLSYYGEEMINMLKSIKKHVYKLLYEYHYHISNYYYRKGYWNDKVIEHANKEFEMVEKLIKLEGI